MHADPRMTRVLDPSKRRDRALRIAGAAVAAMSLGVIFERCTIEGFERKSPAGEFLRPVQKVGKMHDRATVVFAGSVAGGSGETDELPDEDLELVADYLGPSTRSNRELAALINLCEVRARDLVAAQTAEIKAVADALRSVISGKPPVLRMPSIQHLMGLAAQTVAAVDSTGPSAGGRFSDADWD